GVDHFLANKRRRAPDEHEQRFTPRIVRDLDVAHEESIPETRSHRLSRGFLGREPAREEMRRLDGATKVGELALGQYAGRELLAVTLEIAVHARHAHDVGADAVDHGVAASRINRFISRTASPIPVKTARAMMA